MSGPTLRSPMTRLTAMATLVASVHAHISMAPNYGGASGGYMLTQMKVPHGHHGLHTSRMVVHVPRGVMSARPEVPSGWNASVIEYELAQEDRYTSHGRAVTTGPDKIIFQAETPDAAVYTDHLMMVGLQLKLGCSFRDQVQVDYSGSNSIWNGQYTLWFKVDQHSSATGSLEISETSAWAGALADGDDGMSPGWNPPSSTGLKACPYLFIYPGNRCSLDHSGESVVGGMEWMGVYLPPVPNQNAVLHEQHVIELATEASLSAQEAMEASVATQAERIGSLEDDKNTTRFLLNAMSADQIALATLEARYDAAQTRVDSLEADQKATLYVAWGALGLSLLLTGVVLGLCCFRITAKESFARVVSAAPLLSDYKPKDGVTMTSSNGV